MTPKNTRVVIQAGGKGSRLYPYTKVLPKPLMPVGGMPILEIMIRQLASQGFRDLIISIGYLGDMIRLCCGHGEKWGVKIEYVTEEQPLGTMGPLKMMTDLGETFLVMNGDLLTDFRFDSFLQQHSKGDSLLTIGTYQKPVSISLGVLKTDEAMKVVGFTEKPTLHFPCSMGIYAMQAAVLDLIPEARAFGFDDLMHTMLEKELQATAYIFNGTWMDIGRPEDFQAACDMVEKEPGKFIPNMVRLVA